MKPREKLLKYWPKILEWWELVATILWSRIKWIGIMKLSKKVNKVVEEKKENIFVKDLLKIKWIWSVKAMQIISAFELANRYFLKDSIIIESPIDVLKQVHEYRNKKQEYLLCLTLDWASRLINLRVVTIWLLNQSLIHPREVFVNAIEDRAYSLILVHNHPSWSNSPSQEDVNITMKLQKASEIIWIKLRDHIIITKNNYFSFRENEML